MRQANRGKSAVYLWTAFSKRGFESSILWTRVKRRSLDFHHNGFLSAGSSSTLARSLADRLLNGKPDRMMESESSVPALHVLLQRVIKKLTCFPEAKYSLKRFPAMIVFASPGVRDGFRPGNLTFRNKNSLVIVIFSCGCF